MHILVLDVGGTFIKYAVMDEDGACLRGSAGQQPMHSDGARQDILDALIAVIERALAFDHGLHQAAVCFPGPFDYPQGFSRMTHKFAAIQDVPLKPLFAARGLTVDFLHDSTAFMLGECQQGAAQGSKLAFGVMLGTGFGFAMAKNGRVQCASDLRPALILWNQSFREGIVEDYISRRALRAAYQRLSGCENLPDVHEIAALAHQGVAPAQAVFEHLGADLAALIKPYAAQYGADRLVIGGQIAKSADLFVPVVQKLLPLPVVPAAHIEDAALRGAACYARTRAVDIVSPAQ